MGVIDEIKAERDRQIEIEGFTPQHDDAWVGGELAKAAGAYAYHSTKPDEHVAATNPATWPWPPEWWRSGNPRRDLIKAAALIVAEIERLDRIGKNA